VATSGARQVRQAVTVNGAWRCEAGAPGGDDAVMMLQAHGAWRCVMPTRRSDLVCAWRHEMRAKRFWFSDGAR